MGAGADRKTLGNGIFDLKQLQQRFRNDIAENTGNDDCRDSDRNDAAEFFGYTHTDGSCDGLRQEGDELRVTEAEQQGHDQNASHACQ